MMLVLLLELQVQIKNGLGYKQQIVGLQRKILMLQQVMNTKLTGTSLSGTTLGAGVTASSLTTVGTLALDVDNINPNGSTITVLSGMTINANGDVNFANKKNCSYSNTYTRQQMRLTNNMLMKKLRRLF